ncbi:Protein translocase subunit SecA [Dissostichus eleginoides]|uniref:Protein translocase subunit SecA n=1 Tax=Dissostichus eleginoides TaxID=100907 RepID=A0AAD9C8J3_DISEL|nr:Protein translocase subunit SecA [Dissostichus eleginoides]
MEMKTITMNQGSVSSCVPAISEVLNVITQEVKYITKPGLEDLSDSELEDLQFESSLEIEQVAGEITQLMAQNQSIGNTIMTCLSKTYVKASIHRMATQTRRKYYTDNPAVLNRGSLQIMVDKIWDALLKEDGEHPEEGEEVCVVEKFKGTVPVRILKITHTIVDLLYEFVNSLTSWHQFSRSPSFIWANGRFIMFSNETVPVRLIHPGMRKYIERESGSFQMMTSSWMNHQIQVHSDRVQLALMKDSSVPGEGREPWATGPTIFEVLDILSEDVNYILCNVLTIYELSDSEFQDLAFESSLEVKQVAAEITELMNKQKSIGNTIRTFLAKEYVKASIHCMVKQTSRMHYQVGAVEKSRRSLQIVVDEVWDVLLKEDGEHPEEVEEVCVVQKFKDTVPVRIPEITQTLVDLLFEFVIASSIWQDFVNATWMSSEGVRSKMISDETVIEYQKGIKQDIRRLSESFLKEMSWWMNHQIQVHSERVQLAVIKARYAPPRQSNPFTIPTQVPEVLVAEVRETLVTAVMSGPFWEETPTESNPITTQVPGLWLQSVGNFGARPLCPVQIVRRHHTIQSNHNPNAGPQ